MHDTSAPTTGAPTFDAPRRPRDRRRPGRRRAPRPSSTAPKSLPPKWFYDERSRLFDAITRLPEYYPTEAEREILLARAAEIVDAAGADTVVELGSGTSDKTRALLDAATEAGSLERFVPFDVSEATLRDAAAQLGDRYPGLRIHGVVGDFDHHLDALPRDGRRLVLFLGGTIGNFTPAGRRRLLDQLCGELQPGDTLLPSTDLVKPASRLIPAYDDAAGVTASSSTATCCTSSTAARRRLRPERFEHQALLNSDAGLVEMHRGEAPERVRIAKLDMEVTFAAGESIHTEISAKFRRDQVTDELARVGMATMAQWTDEAGEFAVTLAKRTEPARPSAPAPAR
ncbi:MAG: L-histidine N(alpha)-methyltransferase [Acidimicrobiales bacterium]